MGSDWYEKGVLLVTLPDFLFNRWIDLDRYDSINLFWYLWLILGRERVSAAMFVIPWMCLISKSKLHRKSSHLI